jgi:flagellar biosynthesis/type III secretory pathway M-ring protein FliF/YscJ
MDGIVIIAALVLNPLAARRRRKAAEATDVEASPTDTARTSESKAQAESIHDDEKDSREMIA